jgi:hypothetical protein
METIGIEPIMLVCKTNILPLNYALLGATGLEPATAGLKARRSTIELCIIPPSVGLEPTTLRLTAACSTIELRIGIVLKHFIFYSFYKEKLFLTLFNFYKCTTTFIKNTKTKLDI